MNSASNVNDYTLQASCIILCYICYVVSIDHLNESDGALTNSIKADLERVVTTVEQVKGAGNQIMDGVTVVRELEDENRQSSTTVVQGMSELTQNNNVLHGSIRGALLIRDRSRDQNKNQDRSHGLQCADKERAQHPAALRKPRESQSNQYAQNQPCNDLLDQ